MKYIPIILLSICCSFLLQGCNKEEIPKTKFVSKKITITFDGNFERVYPWMSFVAYTEDQTPLSVFVGNDLIIQKDGAFEIEKGRMGKLSQITLSVKQRASNWVYISVTYRKRMKSPSQLDDLKINTKRIVDNVLSLDTTHVMHAFDLKDKPSSSEYIYHLKL